MPVTSEPGSAPIVPFWNRLPRIMLYPAHMSSLITIILLGLGRLLAYFPLGYLWVLLVTVAMYRYAFDCLLATADGQPEPPEVSLNDEAGLGWKFIVLLIMLAAFWFLFAIFTSKTAAVAAACVLVFALPGAIIALAMEQSVFRALNPLKWLDLITRIGWPYLAVFGLCLAVLASQGKAAVWVAHVMPKPLAIVLVGILSNYAMVATFHLMGYLVYQYHEALGFVPSGPQAHGPLPQPDPDQDVLDEAAGRVQGGHPEEAAALLRSHLLGRGGTPKVHQQYRKLLRLLDDKQGLLRHGRAFMDILLTQGNDREALTLLRECQTIDPTFAPTEAAQITRLAAQAAKSGQAKVALQLVSGFHRRFPKSQDVVLNYLLAATLLHEHMNQDEQAHRLLSSLKAAYPNHPLLPQVQERLALIEKMMETARQIGTKSPDGDGPGQTTPAT